MGALALALWVGAGSSVVAQDQQNSQPSSTPAASSAAATDQQNGGTNGGDMGRRSRRDRMRRNMQGSDMSGMNTARAERIRWSDRYRLTPLEHKRLRAMGLTDAEVFGVANAARESGVDSDEIAQMVLRGRSFFQIADQLGVPFDSLQRRRPEWQTAEWEQGVHEGWYSYPHAGSMAGMSSDRGSNR